MRPRERSGRIAHIEATLDDDGSDRADRQAQVIATQRHLMAAGGDLDAVMTLIAERCQALTGADGAMVSMLEGNDMLLTRAATGSAVGVLGAVRPLATSVARFAIANGEALLITDCERDPRINRDLQRVVGDKSLICVPLFHGFRVAGALNVMSRRDEPRLDESDRETIEMLSMVLSAAVSHASESQAVARFRTLFEGASIGIMRLGADRRAREANPAAEKMFGYSARELADTAFEAFLHPRDAAGSRARFVGLMSGATDAYQEDVRYCRRDGETMWAQNTVALERDAKGHPACAVMMVEDITSRKRTEEKLIEQSALRLRQARRDSLTGLPNRVHFAESLAEAIASAERRRRKIAVLMLDLDRFKEVNDSLGHAAGDGLLQEVGRRIQSALRAMDMVARLGGDEFGIILNDAGDDGIQVVIDRIVTALERPVVVKEMSVTIEASIGVAVFPEHGTGMDSLLQRADVAMYAAKQHREPAAFFERPDPAQLVFVGLPR